MTANFRNTQQSSLSLSTLLFCLATSFIESSKVSLNLQGLSTLQSKFAVQVDRIYCLYDQIKKLNARLLILLNIKSSKKCFVVQTISSAIYYEVNKTQYWKKAVWERMNVQLTLEKHRFKLHMSTYKSIFFNK